MIVDDLSEGFYFISGNNGGVVINLKVVVTD